MRTKRLRALAFLFLLGIGSAIPAHAQWWPFIASGAAPSPPSALHYAEFTINQTGGVCFGCGGYSALVGLAGTGFDRSNPWGLDVTGPGCPALAQGAFYQTIVGSNSNGWGCLSPPPGIPLVSFGDVIGLAWADTTSQVWWQNATQAPGTWFGATTGSGAPDPVTLNRGLTYDSSTGDSPISGPAYVLIGVGYGSGKPSAEIIANLSGPFVSAPSGYTAAGGSIDPATLVSPTEIILSGGNLTATAGVIAGSNQPTSFALGTIGYAH